MDTLEVSMVLGSQAAAKVLLRFRGDSKSRGSWIPMVYTPINVNPDPLRHPRLGRGFDIASFQTLK